MGSKVLVLDPLCAAHRVFRDITLPVVVGAVPGLCRRLRTEHARVVVANSLAAAASLSIASRIVPRHDSGYLVYHAHAPLAAMPASTRWIARTLVLPRFDGFLSDPGVVATGTRARFLAPVEIVDALAPRSREAALERLLPRIAAYESSASARP
jgi:hypothetical protein